MGYLFRLAELTMIFAILAGSLNLVAGTAGLMSLGHAAFYGVGAYTAGLLSTQFGTGLPEDLVASARWSPGWWPWWWRSRRSGSCGFSSPWRRWRRRDHQRGPAELGRADPRADGGAGHPADPGRLAGAGGQDRDLLRRGRRDARRRSGCCIGWRIPITATRCGRCARTMSARASVGLDVRSLKFSAFAISGGLAGVAGCLQAHITNYISPDMFQLDTSILILTMVVVGGLGSLPGAVLGAGILILVPELGREFGPLPNGRGRVVLYVSILLMPKGLLGEVWALRAAGCSASHPVEASRNILREPMLHDALARRALELLDHAEVARVLEHRQPLAQPGGQRVQIDRATRPPLDERLDVLLTDIGGNADHRAILNYFVCRGDAFDLEGQTFSPRHRTLSVLRPWK